MLDKILLIALPYLSVLIALAVCLNHFRTNVFNFSKLSEDYLETKHFHQGAFPWHIGILILMFGHIIVFLFPGLITAFNEDPHRLYILEGVVLIIGFLTLFGLIAELIKVFADGKKKTETMDKVGLVLLTALVLNGILIAISYRWLSSWYTSLIVPYLHSLVKLRPNLAYVSQMPPIVKMQLLMTFLVILVFPFSRLLRSILLLLVYPKRGFNLVTEGRSFRHLKDHAFFSKENLKKIIPPTGLIIVSLVLVLVIVGARKIGFTQGYAPTQPIKFSHKLHAGDLKMQCVYCHFGAQSSRHAGVPPTELCLNCHSIIKKDSPEIKKITAAMDSGVGVQWVKVNHFPDFAYFNHSQHVMVAKLACQKCHGEVQTFAVMKQQEDLSMGWCIRCHRANEIAAPVNHKSSAGADCARCHY